MVVNADLDGNGNVNSRKYNDFMGYFHVKRLFPLPGSKKKPPPAALTGYCHDTPELEIMKEDKDKNEKAAFGGEHCLSFYFQKERTTMFCVVCYFLRIFLRLIPARPISPDPSNSIVAGSGTGSPTCSAA